jgi:uncharacterized membrane protein YhaH (DUF805 family)
MNPRRQRATMAGMSSLALFFSAHGRIPPKPFTGVVVAVYAAAFLSQLLVSPPVLQRAGWLPFALIQAIASWAWFCLHAKRLRDADCSVGPAAAIAVLYALAMVLLLLVVQLLAGGTLSDATRAPAARWSDFLVPTFLLALLSEDPGLGLFAYVVVGILVLIVMPIAIAVGFSIWSGSRPSVTTASATPP